MAVGLCGIPFLLLPTDSTRHNETPNSFPKRQPDMEKRRTWGFSTHEAPRQRREASSAVRSRCQALMTGAPGAVWVGVHRRFRVCSLSIHGFRFRQMMAVGFQTATWIKCTLRRWSHTHTSERSVGVSVRSADYHYALQGKPGQPKQPGTAKSDWVYVRALSCFITGFVGKPVSQQGQRSCWVSSPGPAEIYFKEKRNN